MSLLLTQDSAVNTPIVPDANAHPEFQNKIWIRQPHASDSVNFDRIYLWNGHIVDAGTFLKWRELVVLPPDESLTSEMFPDGEIHSDKLAGAIPIGKLNLAGQITDEHIHPSGLSPDVIQNLSGTNTGDQTLSYTAETGVLQLSGDATKTIHSVPTWDAGAKTLTWPFGTVTLSGISSTDNTTQQLLPTDQRFQKIDVGNQDPNVWRQVHFKDKTLVSDAAQQPIIQLAAAGDYMVFGQLGISVFPSQFSFFVIEVGIVNITGDSNATTPAGRTYFTRKTVTAHDTIQFQFKVANPGTSQSWRLVWRAVDPSIVAAFPRANYPDAMEDMLDRDYYEVYDANTQFHWLLSENTWMESVKLN